MRNSNGLYCEQLLLSTGWARDLVIIFDTNGVITAVRPKVIGDNFEKDMKKMEKIPIIAKWEELMIACFNPFPNNNDNDSPIS